MSEPTESADTTVSTGRIHIETVIYDGHCQFCQRQIDRLARWDRNRRLRFLSLHDPRVRTLFPDLDHDELMRHIYLVDAAGTYHIGASAFAYLSRKLPRLWPLAPWLHIPGSKAVWQWLYHQLAKRRYAMNRSDSDVCGVNS